MILTPVFTEAYTDYGVGIISGSMFDIVNTLTVSQTEQTEELGIQCCDQGVLRNTTCGNGVSCVDICGDTTKGKIGVEVRKALTTLLLQPNLT